MTVTIQLSDEQAAALKAQAANEGLTVDAWLQRLAEKCAQQPRPSSMQERDERPIWEVIADNMKDVPPEVMAAMPEDGASQHDHYIYGWPKREV